MVFVLYIDYRMFPVTTVNFRIQVVSLATYTLLQMHTFLQVIGKTTHGMIVQYTLWLNIKEGCGQFTQYNIKGIHNKRQTITNMSVAISTLPGVECSGVSNFSRVEFWMVEMAQT